MVRMASYAPLFAIDAWQWTPDLIWADNLRVCATPNYYVQQLFICNRGDVVLPNTVGGVEKSASGVQTLYASVTRDDQTDEIILKVVNPGAAATPVAITPPQLDPGPTAGQGHRAGCTNLTVKHFGRTGKGSGP